VKIKFSEEVKAALRTLSKEERRKYVENAVAQQLAKDKQRTVETPRPIFPTPHPVYAAGGSGLGVYPSSGYYAGGGLAPGAGFGGSVCSPGYGHGFSSSSGGNPSNEVTKREEIKNAETEGSQS